MSTFAFKAILIREIEQAMVRLDQYPSIYEVDQSFQDGQRDAYAHILTLISDMENQ